MKKQIKSRFYYYFWGAATVAVCLGQIYVGTGYRLMHNSIQDLIGKVNGILIMPKDNRPNFL
tara:strand:- start:966 stop:1151 length:186 start_codon:yes stop_codon:yes gene_type:complete